MGATSSLLAIFDEDAQFSGNRSQLRAGCSVRTVFPGVESLAFTGQRSSFFKTEGAKDARQFVRCRDGFLALLGRERATGADSGSSVFKNVDPSQYLGEVPAP